MSASLSLRAKLLWIVLAGAVLPLGIVGLWLARTAERSGEELLRARMEVALQEITMDVGSRWVTLRSRLLDLVEDEEVQARLRETGAGTDSDDARLWGRLVGPDLPLKGATVQARNGNGRVLRYPSDLTGELRPHREAALLEPALDISLPVHAPLSGERLGDLEVRIALGELIPLAGARAVGLGSVLAVMDPSTGASLLPLPFDPELLVRERFHWAGEEWITARRRMDEPDLELLIASPLTAYVQPFEDAARRGALALLAVGILGFLSVTLLTRRVTGSLLRLAHAAEAVSEGDLERQVAEEGGTEVARVARAFNAMTTNLRRTVGELAQRESLASLGEFSASLAHEIRNPLTSVRIDLQRVAEKVPGDSTLSRPLARALGEIQRLDETVTGVLRLARSGRIHRQPVELRIPIEAAAHAAAPEFEEAGAELTIAPADHWKLRVRGDPAALEQLFLNLLLNAAQALKPGGRAVLEVEGTDREAVVSLRDTGPGIPAEELPRVFEPFYSTRSDGTGLGLAIAGRIAAAHGGTIEMESSPGQGTVVRVRILLEPGRKEGKV